MSVGTMSINGVQVAEVESFEFTPIVDESSVSSVPMLSPGVYHSIVLPVSIRNEAMSKPLRPCPKGRWVGGRKGDPDDRVYVVRGRRVGLVSGSSAAVVPVGMGVTFNTEKGRRRCESKRWVERTYAEAWYREEMWRLGVAWVPPHTDFGDEWGVEHGILLLNARDVRRSMQWDSMYEQTRLGREGRLEMQAGLRDDGGIVRLGLELREADGVTALR